MSGTHNPLQRFMLRYPRPVGVVMTLLGGFFFFSEVYRPIQQAQAGVAEIEISQLGGLLAIVCSVIGLTYAIFGKRFARLFQPSSEQSMAPAMVVGLVLGGIGVGLYAALQAYIESQGYVFMN